MLTLLSSCRYGVTYNELKETKQLKLDVISSLEQDLTTENQIILKKYFERIKNIVFELDNNSKMQNYLHKYFNSYYDEAFCEDFLLSNKNYMKTINKCTKNGFYICSEEVKYYKELLTAAKKLLLKSELDRLVLSHSCKDKLLGLGI